MIAPSRFAFVCVLTALPALAAAPAPVRVDPARVDAVFKPFDNRSGPGCAVGILQAGKVLYAKGYGLADLNLPTPITPATLFDVGSVSKQFTAASVLLLVQEGKLALTDDIRKYLPEVPDYGTPITVDHLLRHTSGLRDYNDLLAYKGYRVEDVTDDDDALEMISRQRALRFKPGTKWRYNNTGYFLASLLVKRVTGKSLAEFARERFFQPLGMARTHFRDDHTAVVPGRASAYAPKEGGGFRISQSNWDQTGDGQVQTNVLELARWEENFRDPKVGGKALIDALQARGALASGKATDYGRGLFVDTYRGVPRVHHSGGWAGYRSVLMRFPSRGVSFAVLCNRTDIPPELGEKLADAVLEETFRAAEQESPKGKPAEPTPPKKGESSRFVGLYHGEEAQEVMRLHLREGALALDFHGRTVPLREVGEGRFEDPRGILVLAFEGEQLKVSRRGEPLGTFQRVEPVTPSADDWKQLVGAYYSPELDATWRLEPRGDTVAVKTRAEGTHALEPAFADGFRTDLGLIRVTRDGSGRLTGFIFQGLQFERTEDRRIHPFE
ncbi:serine hydrolase domain-containing protein [Archangium primigenium]|uniref:serine hydrolase domain-containing protein n=1 Tax=[Archangium] primigenium TaxID=2792470 RepID=UPI00195D22D3|nr:serine hydrolase domain-containing protein [Archangium primigenium]MBM7117977.1 serine hydrolase [Archangium primigenium]